MGDNNASSEFMATWLTRFGLCLKLDSQMGLSQRFDEHFVSNDGSINGPARQLSNVWRQSRRGLGEGARPPNLSFPSEEEDSRRQKRRRESRVRTEPVPSCIAPLQYCPDEVLSVPSASTIPQEHEGRNPAWRISTDIDTVRVVSNHPGNLPEWKVLPTNHRNNFARTSDTRWRLAVGLATPDADHAVPIELLAREEQRVAHRIQRSNWSERVFVGECTRGKVVMVQCATHLGRAVDKHVAWLLIQQYFYSTVNLLSTSAGSSASCLPIPGRQSNLVDAATCPMRDPEFWNELTEKLRSPRAFAEFLDQDEGNRAIVLNDAKKRLPNRTEGPVTAVSSRGDDEDDEGIDGIHDDERTWESAVDIWFPMMLKHLWWVSEMQLSRNHVATNYKGFGEDDSEDHDGRASTTRAQGLAEEVVKRLDSLVPRRQMSVVPGGPPEGDVIVPKVLLSVDIGMEFSIVEGGQEQESLPSGASEVQRPSLRRPFKVESTNFSNEQMVRLHLKKENFLRERQMLVERLSGGRRGSSSGAPSTWTRKHVQTFDDWFTMNASTGVCGAKMQLGPPFFTSDRSPEINTPSGVFSTVEPQLIGGVTTYPITILYENKKRAADKGTGLLSEKRRVQALLNAMDKLSDPSVSRGVKNNHLDYVLCGACEEGIDILDRMKTLVSMRMENCFVLEWSTRISRDGQQEDPALPVMEDRLRRMANVRVEHLFGWSYQDEFPSIALSMLACFRILHMCCRRQVNLQTSAGDNKGHLTTGLLDAVALTLGLLNTTIGTAGRAFDADECVFSTYFKSRSGEYITGFMRKYNYPTILVNVLCGMLYNDPTASAPHLNPFNDRIGLGIASSRLSFSAGRALLSAFGSKSSGHGLPTRAISFWATSLTDIFSLTPPRLLPNVLAHGHAVSLLQIICRQQHARLGVRLKKGTNGRILGYQIESLTFAGDPSAPDEVIQWPTELSSEVPSRRSSRPFSQACTENGNVMGIWDNLDNILGTLVERGIAEWIGGGRAPTARVEFCRSLERAITKQLKYRRGIETHSLQRVMLERMADSLRVPLRDDFERELPLTLQQIYLGLFLITGAKGWVEHGGGLEQRLQQRVLQNPCLQLHAVVRDDEGIAKGVEAICEDLKRLHKKTIVAMQHTYGGDSDQREKIMSNKTQRCEKLLDIVIAQVFRILANQDGNNIEILESGRSDDGNQDNEVLVDGPNVHGLDDDIWVDLDG